MLMDHRTPAPAGANAGRRAGSQSPRRSTAMYLLLTPTIFVIAVHLSTLLLAHVADMWRHLLRFNNLLSVVALSTLLVCLSTTYFLTGPRPVYLVDFACYKPGPERGFSREAFLRCSERTGNFTGASLDFQRKVLERSGMGEQTYIPPSFVAVPFMFGAIDHLVAKTGVKAKDIGVVVVNCSLFNPTPSLSTMVVNRYKLIGSVISYNLGGMGCSAGLLSIDLAKDLLQLRPSSYALVVSTETITPNWYFGNNKSNCLFRMGCAAVLLSNKRSDRRRSKYELLHTVRTHKGADGESLSCVTQQQDDAGKVGVALSKELVAVAGGALRTNVATLGPLLLPLSAQLAHMATSMGRKLLRRKTNKPYIPDLKLALEHFCIHAGGRAVLDEMEKSMGLTDWQMEPSRMSLYRFGNTSSSSLWYELAYSEAKGRIRRRDRIWQIAFGSGFKCNSAVWKALRSVDPAKEKDNPWTDEIHKFPVEVPKVSQLVLD